MAYEVFHNEILQIDQRMDELNDRYEQIKENLESLYCTLRCERDRYCYGDEQLIALSHQADSYIGEVYSLQNRRKLLQDLIEQKE